MDKRENVLLIHFVFNQGALAGKNFWATPGGEVESGETFEQAARRELFEETGFVAASLGEAVLERQFNMVIPSGEEVIAREQFFLFHSENQTPTRKNFTEEEQSFLAEHRWWSLEQLSQSDEKIFPPDIVTILRPLLNSSL